MNILVTNIHQLINVRSETKLLRGKDLAVLPVIQNAYLLIEKGLIKAFGEMSSVGNNLSEVQVFDAIAQFEFMPEFNIWAGRMLVPNDRGNMDGPYYLSSWLYPALVAQYPSQTNGRDTGVTAWGKLNNAHFTYAVGAFEGHNNFKGASSEDSNLMYATRLQ